MNTATKNHSIEVFKTAYPAEYKWLISNPSSKFCNDMLNAIERWGSLTTNQLNACTKAVARQKAEAAGAVAIDVTMIEKALKTARSNGIKRPKLILNAFKFTMASSTGSNPGAVYVRQGEEYLGKIMGGKLICAEVCGEERKQVIVALAANPLAAATAHGLRTGVCSCCGRALTDKNSVELGIGPICASKYGWS